MKIAGKHIEVKMSLIKNAKRIHFVGIGGVGMCGIAKILHQSGYQVSGSDLKESDVTRQLKSMGINTFIGHHHLNSENTDIVVRSGAIDMNNVEINAAKNANIPVIERAEMLAELMHNKCGIAIAGTHGKTTTTSILSHILISSNIDPTFVIGGKLNSENTHSRLGQSEYVVAEADESDASFLHLKPVMAVVTNIDEDHMSTYNNDVNKLHQTFIDFLEHIPSKGLIALCIDDENVNRLQSQLSAPITTYGFNPNADFRAINWHQEGLNNHFILQRKNKAPLPITLNLPGKHNAQNALAAIAIASAIGVSDKDIQISLSTFQGVARRFQMLGNITFENGQATLIDDYGHHPREIDSTISAIRNVWPEKRLVHVFQPHRFSRTKDLFDDFIQTLSKSDQIILLDIYSAGEAPIAGISSEHLAEKISLLNKGNPVKVCSIEQISHTLSSIINEGDILLMQGAGSISSAAHALAQEKANYVKH